MNSHKDFLSQLTTDELRKLKERLQRTKINVLLVGGTGVGKSSTINALFQDQGLKSKATIGESTRPETMDVSSHEINNLVIWDTPGLGDSPEKDIVHREKIIELLNREDDNGQPLIDLVFLILDASSRDFSSAFHLIKEVILPNLDEGDKDRLLVGLNQADQAMKGHYWDKVNNKPEEKLSERLDELSQTVKTRIQTDTGLEIDPIYYSAGCIMEGEELSRPYNLQKLLSFIMERLPKKKRAAIIINVNDKEENFVDNDNKENYKEKVEASVLSSLIGYLKEVSDAVGQKIKEMVSDPENIKWAASVTMSFIKAMKK